MSLNLKYGRYGVAFYTWERGSNLLLGMEVGRTLPYSGLTPCLTGTVPRWVPVTLLKVNKLREDPLMSTWCGDTP